jgi:hypothetical protein
MTDNDLTTALQNLAQSVANHRVEISGQIGALTANVDSLKYSHAANGTKLDRVLELELACPARAGWEGLKADVARAGDRIDTNQTKVESEFKAVRGESTGQVDVPTIARQTFGQPFGANGSVMKELFVRAIPYIIIALVGLGAYLSSGGDTKTTLAALRAVSDTVAKVDLRLGKIETKVDTASKDEREAATAGAQAATEQKATTEAATEALLKRLDQ